MLIKFKSFPCFSRLIHSAVEIHREDISLCEQKKDQEWKSRKDIREERKKAIQIKEDGRSAIAKFFFPRPLSSSVQDLKEDIDEILDDLKLINHLEMKISNSNQAIEELNSLLLLSELATPDEFEISFTEKDVVRFKFFQARSRMNDDLQELFGDVLEKEDEKA